jgi:ComF family protein
LLTQLRSVYRYEGGVRTLVHAFKFRGQTSLGKTLGEQLTSCYIEHGLLANVVVPVPLAASRRRSRGYNQASLLARELSRSTGIPVTDALRRVGHAKPQANSATAEERRANVIGAFEANQNCDVTGLRVLIIDDVATTGATLNACAEALLAAGAAEVIGLTLARED